MSGPVRPRASSSLVGPASAPVPESGTKNARPVLRRDETRALFDGAARGYKEVAQVLSGGQYLHWRDRLVAVVCREPHDEDAWLLDVATGTGLIASRLRSVSGARVLGVDLTPAMLRAARRQATTRGDPLAGRLVQADVLALPLPEDRFEVVTMSYLLRYVEDPQRLFDRLVAHVRPGGLFGFIEFFVPPNPFWRVLWRLHTRIVLPAGGALVGRGWWRVGRFLGPSIERFWKNQDLASIRRMMERAGLEDVQLEPMSLGGGLVGWGRRPG